MDRRGGVLDRRRLDEVFELEDVSDWEFWMCEGGFGTGSNEHGDVAVCCDFAVGDLLDS